MSAVKRNLLNVDEILRIPSTKLLSNLRGNKPLLLDKMMYKEHPLANKLKDTPISEYKPNWTRNLPKKSKLIEKEIKQESKKKTEIDWDTF